MNAPDHDPSSGCAGTLLHNMSVPPKTTIRYAGLGATQAPGAANAASIGELGADPFGTPLRFCLPAGQPTDTASLLGHFGLGHLPHPERLLAAQIECGAEDIALPDACLVIPSREGHARCEALLWILVVLTQSSGNVWLRGKTPNLSRLATRPDVSLLLPVGWPLPLPVPT